ncbi:MAG TPA: hypothetical protein ENK18_12970 [Deltaproteobacteria bacterium]|nr:hypothetical protein [Deltaproteobacteria bacterium]
MLSRHPALLLVRWWWRLVARPLRDHGVIRWFLLSLLWVELDAMINLAEASRQLRGAPPALAALALGALVSLQAISEARITRDLILSRRSALLRRQPVPGWTHGPAVAGILAVLVAPVGGLGLLWYRTPTAGLLWTGLAMSPALLWAGRRPLSALGATAAAAGLAAAAQRWPGAMAPLAGAIWLVVIPGAGLGTVAWAEDHEALPHRIPWRPRSAVGALLQRDLICLWRRERRLVLRSLGIASLLGLVVAAMRINGPTAAPGLAVGGLVGLSFVAPGALSALGALGRHLGPQLDPPTWPIPALHRAAGLAVIGATTLAPSWAAAAVGGAPILGPSGHLRIAAFVIAVSAGASWALCARPDRPDYGLFPWWIALCLASTLLHPVLGGLGALLLASGALWRATQALVARRWAR